MAGAIEPVGDHTTPQESTEDVRGTVVTAARHNDKGKEAKLQLVMAEIDEGESTVYDQGLYRSLAAGRLAGRSDEEVISEAARLTKAVRNHTMEYTAAFESTLVAIPTGNVTNMPAQVQQGPPAAVNDIAASGSALLGKVPDTYQTQQRTLAPDMFLPNVKVAYEGPFGTMRTRYHSVEVANEFLVLTFDKRCEVVDVYYPPQSEGLLEITVGDKETTHYYVKALGVNLDLDSTTVNRYIVVLPIVPNNHDLVIAHLGDKGDEFVHGELDPTMSGEVVGMPSFGQSSL